MSKTGNWEKEGNIHIGMAHAPQILPHHSLIARLTLKYSKSGDKILDLGCGRGQIASLVTKNQDREVSIADAYQKCLDETASCAPVKAKFLIDEKAFDIDSKISGGPYDVIIASHVLEHLYHPMEAIKKIMALTKRGGFVIIAVPNPVRPNILISNIFRHHYVNRGHVHAWDMSHWKNFLENINNLTVVEYAHDFIQLPGCYCLPFLRGIGTGMARIVPWWSFSNIAVIRKES